MGKLLIFVYLLVLMSLSLGEIVRISIGDSALTITEIFSAVLVFLFLVLKIKSRKKFNVSLSKPIAVFILIAVVSLLINSSSLALNQIFISALYIVRFCLYASLYLVISTSPQIKKVSPKLIFISGFIFIIVGYLQYFFYPNLRNLQYLGWDVHLGRYFGSFLDPNFTGLMLVLFLVFNIFNLFKLKLFKTKIYMLPFFLLNIIAIILTYSRTSYISLLILGLFTLIYFKKTKFVLVLLIPFLMVLVILIGTGKTENTNILRVTSSFARLENYSHALRIFEDHPILGVGYNTYRYTQQHYGFIDKSPRFEDHAGAGSDNSFLLLLATTGVLGFIAYINLLWVGLKRKYLSDESKYLYFATTLVLVVGSLFINALFYSFFLLWFFIIAGITENS